MVELVVGKKGVKIAAHKALLCHYSSFFRGALQGDFKEAEENRVILDEEEYVTPSHPCSRLLTCVDRPEIVKIFVSFLYSGKLYEDKERVPDSKSSPHSCPKTRASMSRGTAADQWPSVDRSWIGPSLWQRTVVNLGLLTLSMLWSFGDRRGVPYLQNKAIDAIHQCLQETKSISAELVAHVWPMTLPGARLRNLILEWYRGRTAAPSDSNKGTALQESNAEFLKDLCFRLYQARDATRAGCKTPSWPSLNLCDFHVHDSTDCKGNVLTRKEKKGGVRDSGVIIIDEVLFVITSQSLKN